MSMSTGSRSTAYGYSPDSGNVDLATYETSAFISNGLPQDWLQFDSEQHRRLEKTMKIGVTSQNFRTITGHEGKTRRFMVYESLQGEIRESERLDLPKEMSMHEFRGDRHPLDELDVLIVGSAGQGFIRRLEAKGVRVVATSETDPLKAVSGVVAGAVLPPPVPHEH
jgi:predicted Fe-Mo cluster-binding NifX family protein